MRIEIALQLEPLFQVQAKENQKGGKGGILLPNKSAEAKQETREKVAKLAGVSHDTVSKHKKIKGGTSMSFSGQLRKAMAEAEISQIGLCRKTGLSKSSISQYASGKNIPSQKSIKKIAEALNCTVEFLFMDSVGNENLKKRNLSIADAALRLDKSQQFIRIGLQTERLPIGTAVKMSGGRWSYHISAKLLDDYIGKEDDE